VPRGLLWRMRGASRPRVRLHQAHGDYPSKRRLVLIAPEAAPIGSHEPGGRLAEKEPFYHRAAKTRRRGDDGHRLVASRASVPP
jgi:hypothetical protein